MEPVAKQGLIEGLAVALVTLIGGGGLWRWVAGRVAQADKEAAERGVQIIELTRQLGELNGKVIALQTQVEQMGPLVEENRALRAQVRKYELILARNNLLDEAHHEVKSG
jgi:hypothetical protein